MKYCLNCGAEIPDGCKFCTKCGTPVPDEEAEGDSNTSYENTVTYMPNMKWYNFTIYAGVFLIMVIYIVLAVLCATGFMYVNNRSNVYSNYPGMFALNIMFAAFYLIMAIMAIVVRQTLVNFRKIGPGLYIGWLWISLIGWLSYDIVSAMIIGRFVISIIPVTIPQFALCLGAPLLINLIYIIFNIIYFYKDDRNAMFTN